MTLLHGDCQKHMQDMASESIDLIYADPPFFTQKDWGQFCDKWQSLDYYLMTMRRVLLDCHRLLKPTGSIYWHCDWRTSHHVRLLLDGVFGAKKFKNEIIHCIKSPATTKSAFLKQHTTIYLYSKSAKAKFNVDAVRVPHSQARLDVVASSKSAWDMFDGKKRKMTDTDCKKFALGMLCRDWWADIPSGNCRPNSDKVIYPTQKPIALLERIIKASSDKGDTVLDPFCGSGTTLVAAKQLGRDYIGIDCNAEAIAIAKQRLR